MFFNSLDFAIFLPIVFILYWFFTRNNLKIQNFLIVISSYVFYGWWDWRFLSLIIFSTIVDFNIGKRLKIEENQRKRKRVLLYSIIINIGFLGFFKYYNFFLDNFVSAFSFFGMTIGTSSLNIILPAGISFYTFQTMSYTIDVYNRKLKPTESFIDFSAFVSFFPQLVAGPIERASNLLPQFHNKREFNHKKAADGLRQILWGLFKKIVIANNCALYANEIFTNYSEYPSSVLILGSIFFAFQIYGDFSGYSDIAIGTSRLFGFNLKKNFDFPYFSRDIAEFWRRWHISLSSWFRDYIYIPLGGSHGSITSKIINTFTIFIISGFWHGANWTYIVWGFLNALYFLPLLLTKNNRNNIEIVAKGKALPKVKEMFKIGITFSLILFAWIFFRAESIEHAFSYIAQIFSDLSFPMPYVIERATNLKILPMTILIMVVIFIFIEWIGRDNEYALEKIFLNRKSYVRYIFYYLIIVSIIAFNGEDQAFIYFQF